MFNIALYQPDIPQNTASIIRLCACFGATLEIIEPCGFRLEDKRLKKVAMDYLDKCKIIIYKSYEDFLLKKKKSRIILMTTKGKKKYFNFKFKLKDTLLFGRESEGVPNMVHIKSFERLKIPIKNDLRSLNITVAAAITLSEAIRQNTIL
ncbi:MAG: tRNA methyltransferase [Proteobacteria bacterium TMED261]|nr:MAG: tRNA methyltransferase [Proteobacteria bacterium TMED261]|tara:strand:- start:78 stop:527 length:450 start_codon:yes stop_codon:yes gene_type:complete